MRQLTGPVPATISKVLIANRGEIALRVVRACRDAGYSSVAAYADPDRDLPFVQLADEALPLHGASPAESYLDMAKILQAANASGADAVHPGYGFLSENADFAQAVQDSGLIWIGPSPRAIRLLGDKVTARQLAAKVGAPLVPGSKGSVEGVAEVLAFAEQHGLPIAIKATFGGGGRGLRVARTIAEVEELYDAAVREAVSAFGRGECFVERYLDEPRHVEAQVLADSHGSVIIVGTRDCSLQRRHQKMVEEAPAPFLSAEQRATIYQSSRAICHEAGYENAGTVEFLVGKDGTITFLEVNTRLQVEHPVTEETTGVDVVREQFRIAEGQPVSLTSDPVPNGHAFEFRINCEDPARNFMPSPGMVTKYVPPAGPGVRMDSGVQAGSVIDGRYDSMMAKLIVHGRDRQEALERSRRALSELVLEGLPTVVPFHKAVLEDGAFNSIDAGSFTVHTRWIETKFSNDIAPFAVANEQRGTELRSVLVEIGGRELSVRLPGAVAFNGEPVGDRIAARQHQRAATRQRSAMPGNVVTANMQGTLVKLHVTEGQAVAPGDLIAVIEAMKMENPVLAHMPGTVTGLRAEVGTSLSQGSPICTLEPDDG
jgi:acetyl-CoA/propionyl-CoA carboxylase biotin carboxyl carrier protein